MFLPCFIRGSQKPHLAIGFVFRRQNRGRAVIFWPCLSLRLIAIGFDLRFFHAELARGTLTSAPGFHRSAARQSLQLRESLQTLDHHQRGRRVCKELLEALLVQPPRSSPSPAPPSNGICPGDASWTLALKPTQAHACSSLDVATFAARVAAAVSVAVLSPSFHRYHRRRPPDRDSRVSAPSSRARSSAAARGSWPPAAAAAARLRHCHLTTPDRPARRHRHRRSPRAAPAAPPAGPLARPSASQRT